MQLFQLAKEQLKSIHKQNQEIRERVASSKVTLPLSHVDLPIFTLRVFAENDEQGLAIPHNVPDILLPFKKDDDKDADYKAMEGGVNDFVFSALLVAFNMTQPTLPMDDMPAVRLAQSTDEEQFYLRFIQFDPEKFGVSAAAEALDKMELMMFSGWKRVRESEPAELAKRFVNEEQASLAGHLINCMARAAGYTEEEIAEQFRASDDGLKLYINRDLMVHLAEVEQTFHADFVRVKH
jgi:hypothetical protein